MLSQEQINARDTILKAVTASNNQQYKIINSNYSAFNISTSSTIPTTTTTTNNNNNTANHINNNIINNTIINDSIAIKQQQQNQTFVNNVFSEMSYNDYKKEKIKSLKNTIWNKVIENKIKDLNKPDKHIKTICENKKIHI